MRWLRIADMLSTSPTIRESPGFSNGNRPVHASFEHQAAVRPDDVAIVFGDTCVTYGQCDRRANQLSHLIGSRCVSEDALVAICLERSIDQILAVVAVLKAGAGYLPLDPAYPVERLAFMMKDSAASLLLTQKSLENRLPPLNAEVIYLDAIDHDDFSEDAPRLDSADPLAYVIYTSGSTGRPKGVVMPHGPLFNLLTWQRQVFPDPARTLQLAPLSFDVSFQEIFSTWDTGGTLVLVPEPLRRDPVRLWRLIVEERIERLFLPFVALQQLAEVATGECALRNVITAGEQLRITPQIRRMFMNLKGCALHNHYGPSETHVVTAYTLQGSPDSWPTLPPIGSPIDNVVMQLLEADNRSGDFGELYIGGECVCRGYLYRPELTAQRFVRLLDGARFYRTGDLARLLPDGNFEFLGRADDQVKIRGFRVEPGEVEAVLGEATTVRSVAVAAKEDGNGDSRLIAYIVGQKDFSLSELREFAKQKLPEYLVPSLFVVLDALPMTPSGKIDRRALPVPDQLSSLPDSAPGLTALEKAIAKIWIEVLGHSNVSVDQNFFDAGGDSLRMTRVQVKLRDLLGYNLEITTLFEYPTIRSLTSHLGSRSPVGVSKEVHSRAAKQRQALNAIRKVSI